MRKYTISILVIFLLFVTGCNINSRLNENPTEKIQKDDIVTLNVSYVELKNIAREARQKQDISICEEIPDFAESIKLWCKEAIDFDKNKILTICHGPGCHERTVNLSDETVDVKKYFYSYTQFNLDKIFCDEFTSLNKMECLRFLALAAGNASYCNNIDDLDYKERCLTEVANEIGDITLCNVTASIRKNACIDTTASKALNPAFCELSKNKEFCLGGIEAAKPKISIKSS